ncbi:hypothetical protein R1sor_016489 [Riccia sorocarpa]|uniref:Uncharacterized protein n=1 Tax=Riccia sorocarpa TaxID=122646 RepID=A0ABD3HF44_9MARC
MAAQAGASLHFELYTEKDDVNYIRWKWISKKEAHRVLRGIDGRLLRREFVLNWDDRTQSSTVGGREIPLTIDTMQEYFLLPEGLNPPRSARHYDELSDWVPERSRTAKTWYANDVYLPVWRPIIQLINVVLLGKQKPLEVTGAFLYILKNKVGPADEDENLDWATYFKENVREEIRACKKQMQASGKRKVRPTCIGIVVLHILRTCGIVDDEDIVLSDSDKSMEEVTPPRSARAAPVHVQSSSNSPDRGSQGDGISYVEANWHQAQAQDLIPCLANYWAPMDERDEDLLWSNCPAADRQKFMAELHGHRIQRAGQKAMQFAMAGADQPSQTQDGAGPSNSSQTAATEIGQPIVPAPLSAASLISDAASSRL